MLSQQSLLKILSLSLEQASHGLVVCDTKGKIVYSNQLFQVLINPHQKSDILKCFQEKCLAEDFSVLAIIITNLLNQNPAPSCKEIRILSNELKPIYFQLSFQTAQLNSKHYLLISILEIDQLKKQELFLRQTQDNYKHLVESVNSIILEMNPQGEIIFINNYGLKFFGYRQQELLGKKVTATIVPKKERSSKRNLAKMISELLAKPEKFSNNENENVNKKGERFYISWTNKAILGQDGKLLKIICVGNDLSERKEMEERLKTKLKVQKVLGQISSAILKNTNFTEAISECLPIINQEFGFNFCCFLPIKEAQLTEPISYPPAALKLTKGKDETANAAIIKKLKKALLVKLSAKEKALFKIRPKINSSKPLLAISLTAKKELIGCFLISYQENYNIASLELFWQLLAELISTTYLKEQAENRIFNLYRHIGILNRQISVLFEFISLQRPTAKDQMKMLIAEYAQLISNAHYTLLYEYQDSNQVFTLQATTLKSKLPTEIKELPLKNYPFLQELIEYKIRVQRTKDNLKVKNPFKHANYFIALPIIYKQNLQSALIICFKSSKAVSSTEINFYSVFAGQASLMLAGNLLKSEEN